MNKSVAQSELFEAAEAPQPHLAVPATAKRSGAFTDNMRLPIHRWYRYSAGFSAEWAEGVIRSKLRSKPRAIVFDPFAGSGTTLLAAQAAGRASVGLEHHPFVHRIASAKMDWRHCDEGFVAAGAELLRSAQKVVGRVPRPQSALLIKCYSTDALDQLVALKYAIERLSEHCEYGELLWFSLTSILRECSHAGTAQWQYILPNKSKARVVEPFVAFRKRIDMLHIDSVLSDKKVENLPTNMIFGDARVRPVDARKIGKIDLVLTSPPYPNNYDYADATRLEMTFWGEVTGWSDLQHVVRHRLVRSCSQHASAERLTLPKLLIDPAITPIKDELTQVCHELEKVKTTKGGKKAYDTMIAAYFVDIAKTWNMLSDMCSDDADVCFVIGDSAPYGVYVPVDRWMVSLAAAAGFGSASFQKIRDRNTKWKNRKHTVPLKEGSLWVSR